MPLAAGTKLGPYEIQSAVGSGGMGEVYRARDTRLDRAVAIKVLPTHLSANPDLKARFEREAKAISGLQHPNICVLYDVGSQAETDYLVMEYLEGETLYARIARKPLSQEESLKIATEIADALERAHRSGIVHRDLKPGNVMLSKSGAKLMDFGLAKPLSLSGGLKSGSQNVSSMAAMAATVAEMASPVTVAGTLVGTVQYMSPEQIQGKEADARSDIFAFGAMLYEMLSGKRAFQGKSQLSLASAILEADPEPVSNLQPLTPPALEQIVRTCLAKEPDERFQSAHDLKLQLQWIASAGSQVGSPAVVTSRRKKTATLVTATMIAGWLVAAVAGTLLLVFSNRLTSAQQPLRASIERTPSVNFANVISGPPSLSLNGRYLAFAASSKDIDLGRVGEADLGIFIRDMETGSAIPLPGTESGGFPFWSPDSKYVGFFAHGKLNKVEISGGPVQVLCDAPNGRGGTWNQQGTIVFAPGISGPLQWVSDGGGMPSALLPARKDAVDFTNRNPLFLPDGKHYLFTARGGSEPLGSLYLGSLEGSEPRQILSSASNVAYSEDYLFYIHEGTLTAQKFDSGALRLTGKPFSIAANIEYYNPRDLGYFSVSRNLLVYRRATTLNRDLAWFDLNGKEIQHWGEPATFIGGTFSPGSQIGVLRRANANGRGDSLWLADTKRNTITRLTGDSELEQSGIIFPDGGSVFIASTSGYNSLLLRRWLSASGKEQKILEEPRGYFQALGVSGDGRYVFFSQQDPKTSFDVYYLDLKSDGKVLPLLTTQYAEPDARLSPDDKWLAYISNETGKSELYVTSFPVPSAKWQISNGGIVGREGNYIIDWSAGGKSLLFQQGDKIYNVEVRINGEKPEFSAPKELVKLPPNLLVISIVPDGKRILAARPTGGSAPEPINLILNWQHAIR